MLKNKLYFFIGEVLTEDKKLGLAPYEGFQASVEADLHGNMILNGRQWSKEEQEKFNAQIAEQTRRIAEQTQQIAYETQIRTQQIQHQVNDHLNQVMYNLNQNLQNTFSNIFGRR